MAKSIDPFRYFDSPEVIRLVVMMYVRYRPSWRNVEDLLFERGIDICHDTARPTSDGGSLRAGRRALPRGQAFKPGRHARQGVLDLGG